MVISQTTATATTAIITAMTKTTIRIYNTIVAITAITTAIAITITRQ